MFSFETFCFVASSMSDRWISSLPRAIFVFMALREIITSFETMNFIDDEVVRDLTVLCLLYDKP
jgi:hypothetical protein